MYKPFNLRALLLASLLTSACGGDLAPTDTDLDNVDPSDEDALPSGHDAGALPADTGTDAAPATERDSAVANAPNDAGLTRDAGRVEDAGRVDDAGRTSDAGRDAGADAGSGDTCSTLNYESFGRSFIQQYCLSCHGGAGVKGVSLDSLAKVRQRAASVKLQVTRMSMPERNAPQPSAQERQRLGQWIDCGAK